MFPIIASLLFCSTVLGTKTPALPHLQGYHLYSGILRLFSSRIPFWPWLRITLQRESQQKFHFFWARQLPRHTSVTTHCTGFFLTWLCHKPEFHTDQSSNSHGYAIHPCSGMCWVGHAAVSHSCFNSGSAIPAWTNSQLHSDMLRAKCFEGACSRFCMLLQWYVAVCRPQAPSIHPWDSFAQKKHSWGKICRMLLRSTLPESSVL